MNSLKPMSNELQTDDTMRHEIATSLAEALLASGQLSALASDLAGFGLIYLDTLPSKPTVEQAAVAMEAMLRNHPEIVPLKEFFQHPEESRVEWAEDQLSNAATGAGDFQ